MASTREDTRSAAPNRTFWWDRARPLDADVYPLHAVIFDLDALADIEGYGHRVAYNAAFAEHGIDVEWSVDDYRRLRSIRDERERVATDLRLRGVDAGASVLTDVLADDIYSTKTVLFEELILDADLAPRAGLIDLVMDAFVAGVWVAVVTGGQRSWTNPLVRQLVGDGLVETVVTADDLTTSTPGPEGYQLALWELGIPAESALAMTGSAAGLRTARSAGLATVVVTTDPADDDDVRGSAAVRTSYESPDSPDAVDPLRIASCQRLHSRYWAAQKRRGWSAAA